MAVTISSADKALKSYYLEVVADQLNYSVNPFLAKVKQTSDDVWGKEIRKLAIYGLNGGIGAGTEDGDLPEAAGNQYENFVLSLKNLYGSVEISDKAVRAAEHSAGAFVNLLNAEMEGLLKASSFNFGRMLFGDGSGKLATVSAASGGVLTADSVKNLIEGMTVDFRTSAGVAVSGATGRRILTVDRGNKTFTVSGAALDAETAKNCIVTVQGSYQNELTGLAAIFGSGDTLYGLSKASHSWLKPYRKGTVGAITETAIQTAIDEIEAQSGGTVDFIITSWGVRRALQKLFAEKGRNTDVTTLAGGYKAMTYNGIPIVADRFCPDGTMYLLNSADFALHQLCDWQWLEGEDGSVLRQVPASRVQRDRSSSTPISSVPVPTGRGCSPALRNLNRQGGGRRPPLCARRNHDHKRDRGARRTDAGAEGARFGDGGGRAQKRPSRRGESHRERARGGISPLVKTEAQEARGGKIYYTALSERPIAILSVRRAGEEKRAAYRVMPAYLALANGAYEVEYRYYPAEKGESDACDYGETRLPKRVIAYGAAAEYCMMRGLYEECSLWDKRFKDSLAGYCRPKRLRIRRPYFA